MDIVNFDRESAVRVGRATLRVEDMPIGTIRRGRGRRNSLSNSLLASSTLKTFPCKITGGSGDSYTVAIYANGKNEDSTGTGTLSPLSVHINETLAVGTWVVGHTMTVEITGGP